MMKLLFILVLNLGIFQYASAVCNTCTNNGVACVNETSYNLCFNGVPDTTNTFSCMGKNEICTKYARVCLDKDLSSALPACGDTTNCGKCVGEEDDGIFTCTSRTTFTMCMGGVLTDVRGICPKNQMCSVALGKQRQNPCVPSCKEREIEFCDLYDAIDAPVTTTVVPPTTTTEKITTTTIFSPTPPLPTNNPTEVPTQTPPELVCSQQTAAGRYPYSNDPTCNNYIYCYKKGGIMHSTFLKCLEHQYFNPSTRVCGTEKPKSCR